MKNCLLGLLGVETVIRGAGSNSREHARLRLVRSTHKTGSSVGGKPARDGGAGRAISRKWSNLIAISSEGKQDNGEDGNALNI